VVIPEVGAALSAAGALLSDLTSQVRATAFTTSSDFDRETVNRILDNLEGQCREFIDGPGRGTKSHSIEFSVEARYNHQVWEIEVPLNAGRFENDGDVERFVADFHAAHEEIFAFRDPSSIVEMVGWSATARCSLQAPGLARLKPVKSAADRRSRPAFFSGSGSIDTAVHDIASMTGGQAVQGPAIIESPFTTVVVDPGSSARLTENGNLMISL
jgi:N-methylhydantoinase A